LRLFVAVEIEGRVKERIARLQGRLKTYDPIGAVRWVRPENLHLTLKFLGEVQDDVLPPLERALERVGHQVRPGVINLRGVGVFPRWDRPRVIWVGAPKADTLAEAAAAVDAALVPVGFEPEERPFAPHLTIGRVRRSPGDGFAEVCKKYDQTDFGTISLDEVSLVRSRLTPKGPIYTVLRRFSLG